MKNNLLVFWFQLYVQHPAYLMLSNKMFTYRTSYHVVHTLSFIDLKKPYQNWTVGSGDIGARYTRARAWIQINVDSQNPDCVYMVNHRSRSASVLHFAFEDTTLMQCDFYRILTHNTIRTHPLHVHTCTYALIVVKFYSTHAICERSVDNFARIQIDLNFRNSRWF